MLVLCALTALPAASQTARKVMDQAAAKLQRSGGISASFVATSFKGATTVVGATTGNIAVKGNKFKLSSRHNTVWFNGKTQWSLMAGGDEVYVSEPTAAELQSVNPYTFINLYKSGYDMSLSSTTYSGRPVYEVRLVAQKGNASIVEMRVTIDKATLLPHCVRLKRSDGNWIRIQVSGVRTGQSWNDAYFQFDKKDNPKVQVVDLR